MMGPRGTKAAAGAVAAGLILAGVAVDRRRGTRPLATISGLTAAVGYVVATFFPRTRLFGAPARVVPAAGLFALTFDDGPDPRHTPAISRILAERGHQATFFALGRAVRAHPEATRAVLEGGHEIGCHGDDHRLLGFAPPSRLRRQIGRAESAILAATGEPPARLFRAPHGVRSPWLTHVVARRGYRVCAWDGSIFDTAEPGVETIVARAERQLRPGAVILLHDGDGSGRGASRRQTVDALPAILAAAERRGLRSVGLSTLVAWASSPNRAAVSCVEASSRRKRPARTGASAAVVSVRSTAPA